MKGFTKDGKFRPIKPYNKVRKSRETKEQGVKIERKARDTSEYCLACGRTDLDPYGRCEKCEFDPRSLRDTVEEMVIRDLENRPHMTMENEEFGDLVDRLETVQDGCVREIDSRQIIQEDNFYGAVQDICPKLKDVPITKAYDMLYG